MEKGLLPVKMLSNYGILLVFPCLLVQIGLCKTSQEPTSKDPQSTNAPDADTIKWPFWKEKYPHRIQSPIDIITSLIKEQKDLKNLRIHQPSLPSAVADFYNSGGSAYVKLKGHDRKKLPYLAGGPLKEDFIFDQMHFHWGSQDEWGSEHMVDAEAFSMEIHLVHFNSKYIDFNEASNKGDGLAVLTIFAKIDSKDNELLKPLSDLLPDIKIPKTSRKELPWNDAMQWAISGMTSNAEYFTYPGSLTTPGYSENVAFIILPNPITISHNQLEGFRSLQHDKSRDPITDNKRNIQPLNHRPIFKGLLEVETKEAAGDKKPEDVDKKPAA